VLVVGHRRSTSEDGDHGCSAERVVIRARRSKITSNVALAAVFVALYVAVNAVHPLGLGVLLKGVVVGGLSSLVAMGLVLVYRSARIINFSQQVIGGLAATVSVLMISGEGLSYWIAVPIGLAVAVLTGLLIDSVVIQRFVKAPRLILTVATIGVYQLLGAAELGLPNLFPLGKGSTNLTTPFTFHFFLSPFIFTGDDVVAIVVVPIALIGLYWFFVKTDYGVAIRGASDSNERALLLGIPTRNLSRITWMVAAGLSGVGAILSAPSAIGGFTAGSLTSASTLLLPLAAAVLAGMESLPATVLWSLVLGIVNEAVFSIWLQTSYQDIAQFLVIIVGLLIVRSRRARGSGEFGELGNYVAVREVASIPHHLARLREVVVGRVVLLVAVLAAAVLVPLALPDSKQLLMADVAIYAIVGVSIVVLTGWAGQISLGQFAFVGVGAATSGALMVSQHVDFLLAIVASAAVGAVVAVVIGLPALRIPGLYLAVATLAFAVPVSSYLLSSQFVPWLNPNQVPAPVILGRISLGTQSSFYEVCLVVLVLAILVAHNLRRSRTGRSIVAVRDNAQNAAAYGVSPLKTKLLAFVISGAMAGVAGSLFEVSIGGIKSGGLSPDLSITVFVMVVIGGLGSITGAVIGAVYVQMVAYFLPESLQLLATGAGLLILLLVLPEGLGGLVFRARDALLAVLERRGGHELAPAYAGEPSGSSTGPPGMVGPDGAGPAVGAGVNPLAHDAALRLGALEALESQGGANAELVSPDAGPAGRQRPLFTLTQVEAGYSARSKVLFDVSMGVAQSEIVALLGTNGAGKTTVLRAIAGLLEPSKGHLSFIGDDLARLDASDRVRAGLVTVLGGRGIFPSLTVAENLRMATWTARRHQKDPEFAAAATERVLTMFPVLRDRLGQRGDLLSGGEQQMLALAQALLCRPKVLLIDELSLGLSPVVVSQLLEVLRALAASGVTVVIVEQSVNVATAISSRAIFIERGRVRFSGPTPDLSQQPKLLRSVFLHAAKRARKRYVPGQDQSTPVAGSAPAFAAVGLSKQFGGVSALRSVSLQVAPGEILGVIGANGAGKTTLFDVCSGFTAPDTGSVMLSGRDITGLSPAERAGLGLGRVFQNVRLFPSLSVEDALAVAMERSIPVRDPLADALGLAAAARSEASIRARVDELVMEMGLGRFRDRFVSELSTGTRRVVELACALAHEPSVLLLDEPTAGIAQRESEALGELLLGLREQTGAAFVVIEHDVPLVSSIADRLLCMHVGEIIAEGETAEVLNDPVVVAAYLGTDDVGARRSGDPIVTRPASAPVGSVAPPAPPAPPSPAPPERDPAAVGAEMVGVGAGRPGVPGVPFVPSPPSPPPGFTSGGSPAGPFVPAPPSPPPGFTRSRSSVPPPPPPPAGFERQTPPPPPPPPPAGFERQTPPPPLPPLPLLEPLAGDGGQPAWSDTETTDALPPVPPAPRGGA